MLALLALAVAKLMKVYTKIKDIIEGLSLKTIDPQRKPALEGLVAYIQEKKTARAPILLNFICTHNSRRSHLAQVWAQALGAYYQIDKLYSYSGGTAATALYSRVAQTLENQGFHIHSLSDGDNPVYAIGHTENLPAVIGFSKEFDHPFNPQIGFAAIMTCNAADQDCPFIAGAEKRIPLTFQDPKISDGTPEQQATYEARSLEIATELNYIFSKIR